MAPDVLKTVGPLPQRVSKQFKEQWPVEAAWQ